MDKLKEGIDHEGYIKLLFGQIIQHKKSGNTMKYDYEINKIAFQRVLYHILKYISI